ncbi:HPr family phosphocarrier [Bartonella elizabethae Re6043vi]|uniref:HPr family phosphocarrier n=2 Tax=Bartonella elizabethae TaxID=807 RepID=J0RN60_BAREL|nr:HPr family phosphocarrier protein [Bartonella elizabethae]EJF83476.1 HPr family phosphocarrier [Bartonella elizabethae Re6043vi]EJF97044.1 HPr family phosphocarrier [Bartonella elizabethae F9251 = ATCC 49927]VEJ42213.1 Phosphocarrier protein HPr [Bartonella elizabethae]
MLSKDALPSQISRHFNICNKRGLHARASAKFVQTVDNFNATVEVEKDGKIVGGSSIMGLMMLAASAGCNLTVRVWGPEAIDALNALEKLINNNFGEEN